MPNTHSALIADMLRQSLGQGETPFLTISSDSMAPLLKTGDQVGLEPVALSQLHPGDIITLASKEDLLTHRFWNLEGGRLCTRGDRPLLFDPLWPPDYLLGRVTVRRRNGRSLSLTTGRGKIINQHLAWLVMAESHFLDKTWLIRLIHRANFVWANIAVKVIQ